MFLDRFDRYVALYPQFNAAWRLFHLENALQGSAAAMFQRKSQELRDAHQDTPLTSDELYAQMRAALADAFPTVVDKQA